jgi:AcrR family transcriptional regulator
VLDVLLAVRDVLDGGGLESLTMAATAARLGVTPMALYRHVRDRDELLAKVADLVLEDVGRTGPDGAPWDVRVERWMRDVRRCIVARPWVAGVLGTRTGLSPAWATALDRLLAVLEDGPFDDAARARALAYVTRTTLGLVLIEAKSPLARGGHGMDPALTAHVAGAGARWARIAARMDDASDDELFEEVVATTLALLRGQVEVCFTKQTREDGDLTDHQWAAVAPLLPADGGRGPRWSDPRRVVDGIRHRERTGVPWREVPARYGPWRTLYGRHRRWTEDGTWRRVTRALGED